MQRWYGTLKTDNERDGKFDFLGRTDDAFSDNIALHDATKDVDKQRFDFRVRGQDFERFLHLLFVGTTSNIKEVGRGTTVELDDIL